MAAGKVEGKPPVSLAVLDVMMPGTDGIETLKEIRRLYGVDRGTLKHAWTVYLVTDEGRVSYRSGGFRMEDPEEVGRLRGQLAKR